MKTDGRLHLVSEPVYMGRSLRMYISGPEVVLYNRRPLKILFPNVGLPHKSH